MENPLHHFEIHPIVHLSLMGFDISISKAVIAMWVGLSILFGLFMLVVKSGVRLIPGKLQIVAEISLGFIKDMVEEFIGKKEAPKYFPFIATIFFFILACNLDWNDTGVLYYYQSTGGHRGLCYRYFYIDSVYRIRQAWASLFWHFSAAGSS